MNSSPANDSRPLGIVLMSGGLDSCVCLAECLQEAGISAGLSPELARMLARETISGAAELLRLSDEEANVLREQVTSPGGTTAAALDILMDDNALERLFDQAVAAAKRRSQELSS